MKTCMRILSLVCLYFLIQGCTLSTNRDAIQAGVDTRVHLTLTPLDIDLGCPDDCTNPLSEMIELGLPALDIWRVTDARLPSTIGEPLGRLYDDGEHGDREPQDGIYGGWIEVEESSLSNLRLQARHEAEDLSSSIAEMRVVRHLFASSAGKQYPHDRGTESGSYLLGPYQTGDFNHDGATDFLYPTAWINDPDNIWSDEKNQITIMLNDGNYGFYEGASTVFQGGNVPSYVGSSRWVFVADFNLDGLDDIYLPTLGLDGVCGGGLCGGNTDKLYLTNTEGYLYEATNQLNSYPDSYSHAANIGDIDKDGDIDIVARDWADADKWLTKFYNDGLGGFQRRPHTNHPELAAAGVGGSALEVADLNDDQYPEIIMGNHGAREGYGAGVVLWNDGAGNFASNEAVSVLPSYSDSQYDIVLDIEVVDWDEDGLSDLILSLTRSNPFYSGYQLQILLNNGDGGFVDATAQYIAFQPPGEGGLTFTVNDVDGDGDTDVFINNTVNADWNPDPVSPFWENDGDGNLTPRENIFETPRLLNMLPIDVDGDGDLDAVNQNVSGGDDGRTIMRWDVLENLSQD